MAKKLYVGGLPFATTNEELKDLFANQGEVTSATIITDKFSGRSRGFGFVEMSNDDEATKAVDSLNGSEFGGRKLVVNEARPMGERKPGGFGGGRGGDRGGYGGGGGGRGGYGGGGDRY